MCEARWLRGATNVWRDPPIPDLNEQDLELVQIQAVVCIKRVDGVWAMLIFLAALHPGFCALESDRPPSPLLSGWVTRGRLLYALDAAVEPNRICSAAVQDGTDWPMAAEASLRPKLLGQILIHLILVITDRLAGIRPVGWPPLGTGLLFLAFDDVASIGHVIIISFVNTVEVKISTPIVSIAEEEEQACTDVIHRVVDRGAREYPLVLGFEGDSGRATLIDVCVAHIVALVHQQLGEQWFLALVSGHARRFPVRCDDNALAWITLAKDPVLLLEHDGAVDALLSCLVPQDLVLCIATEEFDKVCGRLLQKHVRTQDEDGCGERLAPNLPESTSDNDICRHEL